MATKKKKPAQEETAVNTGTGSSTLLDHGVLLHGQEESAAAESTLPGTGGSTLLNGVLVHGQDTPTQS